MTTGTQVSDNRLLTNTSCGNSLIGSYFSRTWSGTNTPPGQPRTPHDFNCTIISSSNPLIQWKLKTPSNSPLRTGAIPTCFGSQSPSTIWTTNDDLKLLGKLSAKIRGNDFNGDAFIAEGRQSVELLASSATRLAGFLEAIRHGNVYKAARYLGGPRQSSGKSKIINALKKELTPDGKSTGALQNAILEVQYGWRPLLSDAYEAGTALGEILTKVPHQTYRVQRKVQVNEVKGSIRRFNCRRVEISRYIVTLEQEPTTRNILHMNDPLAAAWELTPWSFIADWFLPIGSYLSALNLYRELHLKSIVKTRNTFIYVTFRDSSLEHVFNSSDFYSKSRTIVRTIESTSLNPNNVPLPSFKPLDKVFSPEHALNAFALLTSAGNNFTKSLKF